jgi:hypothetical protein
MYIENKSRGLDGDGRARRAHRVRCRRFVENRRIDTPDRSAIRQQSR